MPQAEVDIALPRVLEQAREQALEQNLQYAGGVAPAAAWALVQDEAAVLVDVRTAEERHFVGRVPGTLHVAWATGTSLTRNPRFVRELEARLAPYGGKEAVALLLCRSGQRSALAAEAAAKAGFAFVFNVLEGFEGERDERGQRGRINGWRASELPWEQD